MTKLKKMWDEDPADTILFLLLCWFLPWLWLGGTAFIIGLIGSALSGNLFSCCEYCGGG